MTWEELKGIARITHSGYAQINKDMFFIDLKESCACFNKDGKINIEFSIGKYGTGSVFISENRTPEQMYQIILGLKED